MDARQLEYFLAIVDHDGFGRAAQHLHIAQPSLSQSIANLERELGIPLFHRIGRGVVLSAAGRELIEPARQVLRDLSTARAERRRLTRTNGCSSIRLPAGETIMRAPASAACEMGSSAGSAGVDRGVQVVGRAAVGLGRLARRAPIPGHAISSR
jgi:DNA-binding transcriptional LysR family regulator